MPVQLANRQLGKTGQKPKFTNRLVLESSPYLRQHAHNPVNWYAWSDEAFESATKLNRPVLLSVGYSTCHWCHVMEEESFEDEEIARYLNENYIAVKVDREERPDIDQVYMKAVQAMTGSGGWPLTVFLTPDLKPFTGGTYFPPEDKWQRAGMKTILPHLAKLWKEKPEDIQKASSEISSFLQASPTAEGSVDLSFNLLEKLLRRKLRQASLTLSF